LPTLFLCECVLIYLRVEEADAVLRWAAWPPQRRLLMRVV
ncbi:leucine carboxyl methyltransferase, putative, partial [Eimeria acervulina]